MRKKFTNHSARKTTVSKLKKANIVRSDIASHRPQMKKFLNDYYEADEEERRRLSLANEIMRKSKKWQLPTSQQLWLHKLPPSFSGFKSQRFLRESRHVGVSGTDNDEQSLNNSASVLHLWLLEEFSWFQNGRILLASKINAEPSIHNWGLMILKTLTFADDCERSYL